MQKLPPFDELKELAEKDPAALEALRIKMSEDMISEASEAMQPKLRAQLSHINQVIAHGKNPHHINTLLMKELMKQFERFSISLNNPSALTEHTATVTTLVPRRQQDDEVAVER
ncbi:hypothetical protein CS022_09590 [Veronia nyctiphanis]|uniref:DUF3135 domain-containing protein n=1 Tax=Veronia nyctiphanis TaxID=1278244 RepID=A0A4Q0YQY2_9GAMM|nr:DUF3135 domain-containing protein [Veronia nyctiphanis]RXJ73486.1 hypothetical protein CS022_09590 [Veronia nyctiphanis]